MKTLLWRKIAQDLARSIATGLYSVGSQLPTEMELCARYKVSRHTVRAALSELFRTGMIERKPRLGTRVVSKGQSVGFSHQLSTLKDLDTLANQHQRHILEAQVVVVDRALANKIGCPAGERLLRFSNIRQGERTGDLPVVWTSVYVDPSYTELVAFARANPDQLMVSLIARLYGRQCMEVRQTIYAVALPESAALHLQAQCAEPALRIVRHYLDFRGRPIAISVSYHPGKRYAFSLNVKQNPVNFD